MDLRALLGVVSRRLLPLLLCIAAGLTGALVTTSNTAPTYASTSTVIITPPRAGGVGEALQGVQLSGQLLQSYAAVARSRSAAERIRTRLALPDSPNAIRARLSVVPQPETLLINVTHVDTDPLRSKSIADAAALVLIDEIRRLEANKDDKVEANVVDTAQVGGQVGPRRTANLAIGLFLGLVVGAALALLLEALDRTIKTPDQACDLFGTPLLALVPKLKTESLRAASIADQPLSPAGESYRTLRTAVRFVDLDRPLRTLLVTSPSASEGKTTTAANLAVALAQSGESVILVDADLRRGRVVQELGLPEGVGLTSVITRTATLQDAVQDWRGILQVLGCGPLPPNPSEMLGSQLMVALLDDLHRMADVIVIDSAPVLPVTDSVALATQVDGVILVARAGRTQRSGAAEAWRRLDAVGANVVGCVLNGVSSTDSAGYYADYQYLRTPSSEDTRSRLVARFRR
jgi:capsular exopolysaccharide synthesis family protein